MRESRGSEGCLVMAGLKKGERDSLEAYCHQLMEELGETLQLLVKEIRSCGETASPFPESWATRANLPLHHPYFSHLTGSSDKRVFL